MSKLSIDQKTIEALFSDKKTDFNEQDILTRTDSILESFFDYLKDENLYA